MKVRALAVALALGCAPSPSTPPPEPLPPAPAEGPSAPTPPPSAVPTAPEPAPPSACPEGMLLVEGRYCTELEMTCLEKWEAPQNHLWVCERFAPETRCVGEEVPKRFCIDRYEFPNVKGVRPMVMQNFYQAQVHCARRGKRVCTESEWTMACEGPKRLPFPYGFVRDATKCHGDRPWDRPSMDKFIERDPVELERLWQGKKSGESPACVSDYGVYDMSGNADELAASETHGKGPRSDFDNVTTGGPWYKGVRNQCRPKIYSHDESFAYYYLSWRCCAEPDGAPTDPLAPKQKERGWTFDKVEHQAEHSWKLPFNPKVPGDPGYTPAGPGRTPVPEKEGPESEGPETDAKGP
ncbi:MAG: SUMF1/EgtB/PvdO family nonheme iron enzyme [Polyangiaceae bacterium]